jgi:hypothetical protein
MPCDTVQQSKVEFSIERTDTEILQMALEKLGYRVTKKGKDLTFAGSGYDYVSGTYTNGKINVTFNARQTFDVNKVKRAYSQEVVRQVSKRFGWTLNAK